MDTDEDVKTVRLLKESGSRIKLRALVDVLMPSAPFARHNAPNLNQHDIFSRDIFIVPILFPKTLNNSEVLLYNGTQNRTYVSCLVVESVRFLEALLLLLLLFIGQITFIFINFQ